MNRYILCILLGLICSFSIQSEEIMVIESTITGSQEQPKVISIVPWKEARDPKLMGESAVNLKISDSIFKNLDRVKFNRESLYMSATRRLMVPSSVEP